MIESTAFKLFEVWWDEKKSEKSQNQGGDAVIVNNSSKEEGPKPQGISSLLLEQGPPLGFNYDGFGLGIRASMPKMPSFRVKYLFLW